MKECLFLLVWICCLQAPAQVADSSLDTMVQIDPNGLQDETINLGKIKLPDRVQQFSGVRFVDIRPYRSCIGFVKLLGINKKIVPAGGLAHAINSKIVIKDKTNTKDSLIVFVKHFWETRVKKGEVYVEDNKEDDLKKNKDPGGYAFCHLTAVSFIKNETGFIYCGKLDSLITHSRQLNISFADFPEKAVDFLLENLPVTSNNGSRIFSETQIYASLAQPVTFAEPAQTPNGFFLTYNDFKKGKVTPLSFILSPRFYGYKIEFPNEAAASAISDNFWGLCFQNEFYINRSLILNKLVKSGDTYTAMCGSSPSWKSANGRNLAFRFIAPDVSRVGENQKINKYTKERSDFFPLLLNPLTGYLE